MAARTAARGSKRNGPNAYRAQLQTLSRALRDVHRSLVEFSRERYELENGHVEGKAQLFDLLLRDKAFAWLRPLSRFIVAIDAVSARRDPPGAKETARIRAEVEEFISPAGGPDTFGAQYTALLATEPKVTQHHGVLREAIRDLPEESAVSA